MFERLHEAIFLFGLYLPFSVLLKKLKILQIILNGANASAVVTNQLIRFHYLDQDIDDNFSKRVYSFLKKIDPNKHFLQKQMVEFGAYEYKVDNDIQDIFFTIFAG